MPHKILTIVILSYNTKEYLRQCLRSISCAKHQEWSVVVVDNASSDGSAEMAEQEFPWTRVVRNAANLGFAAGNNVALRGVTTPYVMLLNSDAEMLPPYSFDPLIELLEQDPQVAVVTPKLLLNNGQIDWACHRGVPTPWNALTYFSHLERVCRSIPRLNKLTGGYHQVWKGLETVHEIDVCSGAAMVVRTAAAQQVGWLDERFQFYGEDVDWCYSFRQAGWKILFQPAVTLLHHKNISGIKRKQETEEHKRAAERSHALFFATMAQFYEKHYLNRYPAWVGALVKRGIQVLKHLERSQLWPSPRKQIRK